jgi:hypothetical protein
MTSVFPSPWPRESPNHWQDVGRQMQAAVHDYGPLPPLALPNVVDYRDAPRRLHDPQEADAGKLRQPAEQASGACCCSAGRAQRAAARASDRITAGTVAVLEFASVGRLGQSEAKFLLGGGHF